MSLEAAARRCCVVEHGGRRYLVSAPTLGTVILTNALFPQEVAGFAKVAVESPAALQGGPVEFRGILGDLITDTSDGRAGEVLETCCAQIGGDRGDVLLNVSGDPELAIALGVAVLSLCDVPRCFDGAGWAKLGKLSVEELEATRPEGWFDPSDYNAPLGVVALSKAHGCSPMDLVAWPFEVVLMVNQMTAILNDPNALKHFGGGSSRVMSTEEIESMVSGH
jgi:hypothetical protein